jgi:hypothetical protein
MNHKQEHPMTQRPTTRSSSPAKVEQLVRFKTALKSALSPIPATLAPRLAVETRARKCRQIIDEALLAALNEAIGISAGQQAT